MVSSPGTLLPSSTLPAWAPYNIGHHPRWIDHTLVSPLDFLLHLLSLKSQDRQVGKVGPEVRRAEATESHRL